MSAFVVDRNDIRVLVEAALIVGESRRGPFQVYHGGQWTKLVADELMPEDPIARVDFSALPMGEISASQFGQILWDENIRSVAHRYPGCAEFKDGEWMVGDIPGPCDETFVYRHVRAFGWTPEPGDIFRTISCLDYQSCETDDWKQTWAWEAMYDLRVSWCHRVRGTKSRPGHDLVQIPEDASRVVRLSDLCRKS
jgi:hypothetical protein